MKPWIGLLLLIAGCTGRNIPEKTNIAEDFMSMQPDEAVSAQVMLKSASGAEIDSTTVITSDNVQQYLPDQETAARLQQTFAEAGFEVGDLVGNSFSITAPHAAFTEYFQVDLVRDEQDVIHVVYGEDETGYEIPIHDLSEDLAEHIAAVTLTPPPDFGPDQFY